MSIYGIFLQAPLAQVRMASPRALIEVTAGMAHCSDLLVCEGIIVIISYMCIQW